MVIQYPYNLKVFKNTEAVFDENTASWIEGTSTLVSIGKCRDEANGAGGKITTKDGENYIFGATVYMPLGTEEIAEGQKIQVVDDAGKIRISGDVKRFSKNQLNSVLWV